ncbi:phosphatidate cytidylyltransferase [Microbacterium sp. H1-D42]|uniref:phosphatidate cytidylyltransferase n=1 Tax=Microbacterium sp. H1-D42 TaxID=2925844 RepID=UPI001F52C31B|nr:phosphatidate cytidylyltransferase [Microbacterium sp. H1-D42]UNK69362.1 phosphatidate cytidylyltransferase [Microbacterium sp. H1-D42]
MSDDSDSEERPLTRREARLGGQPRRVDPDSGENVSDADDVASAESGAPSEPLPTIASEPSTPVAGTPLTDAAFPAFDATSVPPRPPMPAPDTPESHRAKFETGDHNVIRDQLRAARGELESHVSQAREQFDQANERIKQRTGRDLIVAIVIGVAIGAVLLASLLFVKALFIPFAVAAGLLGTYELSRALRAGGRRIDIVPQLVGGLAILLVGYFSALWLSWVVLFAAVAFVMVWRMVAQMIAQDGRTYGDVLQDVLVGAFVQVYVPFLTSVALMLLSRDNGEWWVLSFVAIAVSADTCAYASGLAFGKHPMAPRISPKKTWEGFAGAFVGALVVGVLMSVFALHLPWWGGLIFGAAILLSATLGDLGESMLKRDLGIKDMSSWLPGHGGLLDRLDSILPSTVPALALSFLLAPWIGS